MSAEVKKEIQLEIAHVLFIDIVGYSKLSINARTIESTIKSTEGIRRCFALHRRACFATACAIRSRPSETGGLGRIMPQLNG
jgi:hypothetical protein